MFAHTYEKECDRFRLRAIEEETKKMHRTIQYTNRAGEKKKRKRKENDVNINSGLPYFLTVPTLV